MTRWDLNEASPGSMMSVLLNFKRLTRFKNELEKTFYSDRFRGEATKREEKEDRNLLN
jgi:hypothetical protein